MIRRNEEVRTQERDKMYDGSGSVLFNHLLDGPKEMNEKGRIFSRTVLKPGCSIGYHVHQNESETYYILSGTGEYDDNGTIVTVHPGDVTFTSSGEGHAIKNIGEEPLELIALILFA